MDKTPSDPTVEPPQTTVEQTDTLTRVTKGFIAPGDQPAGGSSSEDLFYASKRVHVTFRAMIALTVTWTICEMEIMGKKVEEPLYTLGTMCIGFYFGQKAQQKPNQP